MDSNNQFKFLVSKDEKLSLFLESKQFLGDAFIQSLVNKSITLGFQWEVIKETFYRIFINAKFEPSNNNNNNIKEMMNFARLIDEEKFIEQIILLSIQFESVQGKTNATNNNFDLDDLDENEDESNGNDLMDNEELDNHHDGFNDFSNKLTISQDAKSKPMKKPLSAQQKLSKEQEFIMQSLMRINDKSNLRPIVVDGNDVGSINKQMFKIGRIKQVVEFFESREHSVKVILPMWRKDQIISANLSHDQMILAEMEDRIDWTPSKKISQTKHIKCNDDCFILNHALNKKAVIVSNDNFKDFLNRNEEMRQLIEERVLMYSFIDETFMPAEDPLGKTGPSLENFLRFEQLGNQQYLKKCPYKKKCTYGPKCKFWHPERGMHQGNQLFKTAHQSVLDDANEQKMRLEFILNKGQDVFSKQDLVIELDGKPAEDEVKKYDEIKTETKLTFAKIKQKIPELNLSQGGNFASRMEKPICEMRAMGPNVKQTSKLNSYEAKKQNQLFNPNNVHANNNKANYSMTTSNNNNNNNKNVSYIWEQNSMNLMENNNSNNNNNNNNNKGQSHLESFDAVPVFEPFISSVKKSDDSEIRAKLLANNIEPAIIDKVLKRYENETNIEKLIFFANGLDFESSSDFF